MLQYFFISVSNQIFSFSLFIFQKSKLITDLRVERYDSVENNLICMNGKIKGELFV